MSVVNEMISGRKPPAFDHVVAFIHESKAILKFYPAKNGNDSKDDYAGDEKIKLVVWFFDCFGHFQPVFIIGYLGYRL
jgi:hypothetical protein